METSALTYVPLLSNVASNYVNRGFIIDRCLTPVMVVKLTNNYIDWGTENTFKPYETKASARSTPNQLEPKGTQRQITVDMHNLAAVLDALEIEQAGGELPLA